MQKEKFEHTEYGILFDGPALTCESMEHVDAHFQSLKGQLASLTSWQVSQGASSSTTPDLDFLILYVFIFFIFYFWISLFCTPNPSWLSLSYILFVQMYFYFLISCIQNLFYHICPCVCFSFLLFVCLLLHHAPCHFLQQKGGDGLLI